MAEQNSEYDPVEEVAESFLARYRRGERPSLTEYTHQHPELADQIRDLFPALVVMEEVGSVGGNAGPLTARAMDEGKIPAQLGEYRLLRVVGRGGMGIVYEAVQESLGRHVALKVLPFHGLVTPVHLERFRREARAVAKLHHTNIVPVFGVGEHQGLHYYAMQFIQGQGLDAVLGEVRRLRGSDAAARTADLNTSQDLSASVAQGLLTGRFPLRQAPSDARTPPDLNVAAAAGSPDGAASAAPSGQSELGSQSEPQYFRSVARIGVQVAEALEYAHQQGVLHRDIKPSNLLLDTRGTVWVTDFGLAKAEGSDELTHPGDLVGTLRYMAPERLEGQSDPRSDVYGLGMTLYELLALQPAFEDSNRARLLERVAHHEPVPLRKRDARIPRDLETIVLKAIAKTPTDRYRSAAALAEDLRQFLTDKPIRARRTRWPERLWRTCRRNPGFAALTASVAVLLLVIAGGASLAALWLNAERTRAVRNLERAEEAEQQHNQLWGSYLAQTQAARSSWAGRRSKALEALAGVAATHPPLNLRNEAIAYLALTDLQTSPRWKGFAPGFSPVAFDARFERFAYADREGNVSIHQVPGNEQIGLLPRSGVQIHSLLFSPDDRWLAVRYVPAAPPVAHQVWVWDWKRQVPLLKTAPLPESPALDFSPDSRQLAVCQADGTILVYSLDSRQVVHRLKQHAIAYWLAFDPRDNRLAISFFGEPVVVVHDLTTGQATTLRLPAMARGLAWHPDGKLLAVGCGDFHAYVWDVAANRVQADLKRHTAEVTRVAFSRRGDILASHSWDGTTCLWDPMTGRLLTRAPSGTDSLRFNPDDRRLAHSFDGERVGLWEVTGGREYRVLHGHVGTHKGPYSVAFSPDGRLLVSAGEDNVRLWDAVTGQELVVLPVSQATSVLFHPVDGSLYVGGGYGLQRWPIQGSPGQPAWRIGPPEWIEATRPWKGLACSRDGRLLGGVHADRPEGVLLSASDPAQRVLLQGHGSLSTFALSPDGTWAATGSWHDRDGGVKLWRARTGKVEGSHLPEQDAQVRFSPDGRHLVTGNGTAYRFWEVGSWAPVGVPIPNSYASNLPGNLAFTGDSQLLAVVLAHRNIQLVKVNTFETLAVLEAPSPQMMSDLCFNADGTLLAAACDDHTIQLWDLRLLRSRLAGMNLDWEMPPYAPPPAGAKAQSPPALEVVPGDPHARLRQALREYTQARDFRQCAAVHESLGQFREALADCTRALQKEPGNADLYASRARQHARLKEFQEAVADLTLAIQQRPAEPNYYVERARNRGELQQYAAAVADWSAAIERRPADANYYLARADARTWERQYKAAELDYWKALALNPDLAVAYNNLAWLHVAGAPEVRDAEKALFLAERAVQLGPNTYVYLNTLGVVHYRLGHWTTAIELLQRAIKANTSYHGGGATAYEGFVLAMCHAQLGHKEQARQCYDQALHWLRQHGPLEAQVVTELKTFQVEAAALLLKTGVP